jgi:hypothetical protein
VPRWTRLFNQLQAESPLSRVYAIGYPSIASDTGSCGLNVHLSKSELEFSEEMIAYTNDAIQKAAHNAGVAYTDISQSLYGHRLCEAANYDIAVNGLTAGKDAGVFGVSVLGHESYHPNALGHQLIEQAILRQTHNLTEVVTAQDTSGDTQKLLSVSKSGRAVAKRSPEPKLSPKVVKKGQSVTIKTGGRDHGLKPKTTYQIHVDGSTGSIIGGGTTDDQGDLDTSVTIPIDTEPGGHSIDVTGPDQTDEPIDVTQPIYVPASDSDADDDGTPDASDSCPQAANSGVDSDQDDIDDSCDGSIGPPPASPGSGGSTSGSIDISSSGATGQSLQNANLTVVRQFPMSGSSSKVLGTSTVNPVKAPNKKLTVPGPNRASPVLHHRHINWLPWLMLALLLWLLLILIGTLIDRYVDRKSRYSLA